MSRRLKKIGTAIFDIVGFINFRLQETKGNCWIDQLYDKDYWGKKTQRYLQSVQSMQKAFWTEQKNMNTEKWLAKSQSRKC